MRIHESFRQVIGFIEAFQRLGFAQSAITLSRTESFHLQVTVQDGRGNAFSCDAGLYTDDDWRATWKTITESIGLMSRSVVDQCWNECRAHTHASDFLKAMQRKGIVPPRAATKVDLLDGIVSDLSAV